MSDGIRAVDLDGAFSTGGIQQTFATVLGQTYDVTFDLYGNSDGGPQIKQVRVSVDSFLQDYSFDTQGQTRSTLIWQPTAFSFVASGSSATLSFASLSPSGNSWGGFIDNVSVVASNLTCTAFDIDLNLSGPFIGGLDHRQACNTITASSVVVMSGGDLTLQAGVAVELRDGFTVEAGGALTVVIAIPR